MLAMVSTSTRTPEIRIEHQGPEIVVHFASASLWFSPAEAEVFIAELAAAVASRPQVRGDDE